MNSLRPYFENQCSLDSGKCISAQVGNHKILTDQPTEHGGKGSASSHYDLFIASIGCCAGYYVQQHCVSKGLTLDVISITLTQQKNEEGALTGFITSVNIPGSLPKNTTEF